MGIAVGFAVGGVVAISILLGLVTASVIVLHRLHRKGIVFMVRLHTLLKMGRYYNTTMRHYWDMLVE